MLSDKSRRITLVFLILAIVVTTSSLPVSAQAHLMARVNQGPQSAPERPQTPKPPFPYNQRDVTYTNATDKIQLAGTLTVPAGKGPHPAVLLIPGSGPVERNATMLPGHKPFLVIADYLTRNGVAVLRVDDRSAGKSSGNYSDATGENFVNDALAGIEFLRTQREIDQKRIGLIGHSQGGIMAPMVAARSDSVAFVIMLAAPVLPDRINSRIRMTANLKARGTSEEEINRAGGFVPELPYPGNRRRRRCFTPSLVAGVDKSLVPCCHAAIARRIG